jgi:tRNA (adenine37-N6)-methyltransferase
MVQACPLPVIGVVRAARQTPESTPVQAALNRSEQATVEVYDRYVEGLAGLAEFDYAWLLSWLHAPDTGCAVAPMTQVPFLLRPQQRPVGVFATRGPRRVNPIGLSLVRLNAVVGGSVEFSGVDLIDGTPVVDLKPYVSCFDEPGGRPRCGWFDTVDISDGVTPADLGPPSGS